MPVRVLLVFGGGLVAGEGSYRLSEASARRVRAAVQYIDSHRNDFVDARARSLVVFTGGWGEASTGLSAPPPGSREGDLMLAAARPFVDGIDCRVETRSRSTLENVVFSFNGPLRDFTFNRWNPIGIVSGRQHLERIRYLIKKVTGLPNDAIVGIGAREGGTWRDSATEYVIRLISRIVYAGVSDPRVLLRRERILVRLTRRAERLFPVIQRSSVAG